MGKRSGSSRNSGHDGIGGSSSRCGNTTSDGSSGNNEEGGSSSGTGNRVKSGCGASSGNERNSRHGISIMIGTINMDGSRRTSFFGIFLERRGQDMPQAWFSLNILGCAL